MTINRLSPAFASLKVSSPAATRAPRPALRNIVPSGAPYSILAPQHYEPNYAYPLIVWLHGFGGSEQELKRIMPLVSLRNYVSVAVRGPADTGDGYDWPQTPDAIETTEQRASDALALARSRFNIHRDRIFLAGYQTGGTMAIRLALRTPDRFAGAASLAGPFPNGHAPLVNITQARRSTLLIAHCRDSLTYPIDQVCHELALFHAAGMSVTLRQYPCDDDLTTLMLHDLDVWLMDQVTGGASVSQTEPAPLPSEWN
jgi:phospholipase/carboxylesterase